MSDDGPRGRHLSLTARGLSLLVGVLAVLVVGAWLAPAALGADSVYAPSGSNILVGPLDDSRSPKNLFTGEDSPGGVPGGVAIDSAAGKIYWSDSGLDLGTGVIRVGNLDGSGSPENLFPGEGLAYSIAVDHAAGKLYWANQHTGEIRVGNLDGTGTPRTLFTVPPPPVCCDPGSDLRYIAIDPTAGKIYWSDYSYSGRIRVGNLDGSGSPSSLFIGESTTTGIAVDPAAGKVYWTTEFRGVRVGNLDGTGSPKTLFTAANPLALAIDPAAGKIYWMDWPDGLLVGNLDGSGTSSNLGLAFGIGSFSLLRSPAGWGAPKVSGGSRVGSVLTCSQGLWSSDLPAALPYRAPRSFTYQWSLNGTDIPGATTSSYTASVAGSYRCRVTATNQAGSTAQTSAPHTVTRPAPSVSQVGQSHRRWREGSRLPQIASVQKRSVGTTFRFTVNESAKMRFAFTRKGRGRDVSGRCVPRSSKNLDQPACTRIVTVGALTFTASAGAHKVRFQGHISKHHTLKPGRYTLIISAADSAGQRSTPESLTFTIVT